MFYVSPTLRQGFTIALHKKYRVTIALGNNNNNDNDDNNDIEIYSILCFSVGRNVICH